MELTRPGVLPILCVHFLFLFVCTFCWCVHLLSLACSLCGIVCVLPGFRLQCVLCILPALRCVYFSCQCFVFHRGTYLRLVIRISIGVEGCSNQTLYWFLPEIQTINQCDPNPKLNWHGPKMRRHITYIWLCMNL